MFKFLFNKNLWFSIFNDEENVWSIDEPVKDKPLIHSLILSESGFSRLKDAQDE